MGCRQALIARVNAIVPLRLEVPQEVEHAVEREVAQCQPGEGVTGVARDKSKEQSERIAIAPNRGSRTERIVGERRARCAER